MNAAVSQDPYYYDDPTESFTIFERLYDMSEGGKIKENSENNSCRHRRAMWPLVIRIISGWKFVSVTKFPGKEPSAKAYKGRSPC